MSTTIQQLTTQIEELEKRIKAISTSTSTLTQLIAIRDYISNIQEYLQTLNTLSDEHISDYNALVESVDALSKKVDEIQPGTSSGGGGASSEEIESLTTQVNEINNRLNILIGDSASTLPTIDAGISELQTDLAYAEEDIADLNSEISSINSSVGELQTQYNTLNNAQTSLSSAQTSLSSTVSSLDTRLDTAEQNISALTNGIDVGLLDDRILALENLNSPNSNCYKFKNLMLFMRLANEERKSMFYHYKTDDTSFVFQYFKLNYYSSGSGTFTITLYENDVATKTFTVDLSQNPSSFSFSHLHFPTQKYQNFRFGITSTDTTAYTNDVDVLIMGKNISIFEQQKDLHIECANNIIFISSHKNGDFKYGMQAPEALDITFDNLSSFNFPYLKKCRRAVFSTYVATSNNLYSHVYNWLRIECFNDKDKSYRLNTDNTVSYEYEADGLSPKSGHIVMSTIESGACLLIHNNKPYYTIANGDSYSYNEIKNIANYLPGNWYSLYGLRSNNIISGQDKNIKNTAYTYFGYYEDDYIYSIYGNTVKGVSKLCPGGDFLTAYLQTDETVNLYVNRGYTTEKYILTKNGYNYTCTHAETIEDCACYYEVLGNKCIKQTKQGWVIEDISTEV